MLCPLSVFATDTCPAGYYPGEYVELEYLQSTGTQWIDTGYFANNNTEWTVVSKGGPMGGYISGSTGSTACNYVSSSQWAWYSYRRHSYIFGENSIYTTSISNKQLFINDRLIDTQTNSVPDVWQSPYTFILFGLHKGGTNVSIQSRGIVYKFRITENGALIRDFIPVRRLSDNEVGLFDKVDGKFYGNNGTGEFIAGPETGQSFITDENNVNCVLCPANTYKPNAGNVDCTKCPTGTFSPIGSTALGDCAKILHVGEYVVYMPLGKRTEHGLCVMSDGKKYCADVYEKQ